MKFRTTLLTFVIVLLSVILTVNNGCNKTSTPTQLTCYLSTMSILNNGVATQTFEFSYKNNIINRVSEGNDDNEYVFDDDFRLSSIIHYKDGEKKSETRYTYDENTVRQTFGNFATNGDWISENWKLIYVFDENDQLTKLESHIKPDSVWIMQHFDLYEWSNDNISKKEHWINKDITPKNRSNPDEVNVKIGIDDNFEQYSVSTYQYDDKFHPFAANKVLMFGEVTRNNVIKEDYTLVSTNETNTLNYTYEYNNHDYPISSLTTTTDGTTFNTKYEYNCY